MERTPELVQFGDLTPDHFRRHAVWIGCHTADYDAPWYGDTDEETFRPWMGSVPADPGEGMLLARAEFTLADGTRLPGFLTPPVEGESGAAGERQLGTVQPQVFLPDGRRVGFWEGMFARPPEERAAFYAALGKLAAEVFPVRFRAEDGLVRGELGGQLRGFYSVPDGRTVHVAQ